MSMALAIEYTAIWFRQKYGWKLEECGVQPDALPPMDCGQFYVAIDDAGVTAGDVRTDSLREALSITIGIWRRPEHIGKNRRGDLKLPRDKYLLGAWTLHELERAVIVHKTDGGAVVDNRHGLHGNYIFMEDLNTHWQLPHERFGAKFIFPFKYQGRGRMETVALESGGTADPQAFYGYRLRFLGLAREQKMRAATDAIG